MSAFLHCIIYATLQFTLNNHNNSVLHKSKKHVQMVLKGLILLYDHVYKY